MPSDKQEAANHLTNFLGMPPAVITGKQSGTVPARVFQAAATAVGIAHQSRTATMRTVIEMAGLRWRSSYDSTLSESRGGGNVTVLGLWAMGQALAILQQNGLLRGTDGSGPQTESPEIFIEEERWTFGGGQVRMLDPERRYRIEVAAQSWLMSYFATRGYAVEDTHLNKPFDAVAVKGGELLYLEAKGTTTPGHSVIVTRAEVAWARTHPGQCVLGVWAGMTFDEVGDIRPDIGHTTVRHWNPEEQELDPISFDYALNWERDASLN